MKVAFITGGTKGIGYGVAERLLKEGYAVTFTGRSQEGVDTATESLKALGEVLGVVADVRDASSLQKAVAETLNKWGRIDAVIANAGVGVFKNITDLSLEEWNDTIDTNLTGVFNTVKATLDALIAQEGYIITISSLAGTNFFENGTAYNASKFGVTGFSQALMLDVRSKGVKVSTIMPGSVATYFNHHVPNENDAWKIQPEDIGDLVADLLKMNPRTLPSKIEVRPAKVK
ncbi:short-chain dehydrogenase/reductase SDR [Leadbetterella byssophila DSM 17132]|uniref:Short-chain dehydrogenase/reductase SDR n=1 Tax=Leadbetterella byssophila (strain DSM 17132 / JCM 16389 / KACC 11308 / NBRC 106382 / 4M15) TaxID=649349 RepID=E4RSG6_LEAB4|nr:SDR family oxidoreductase [Leadbetterella byssophila]ADQ17702.1 short-chain dehydrogenase/reductase SDR [Leadbetterella byssophila DSM 17132]